MIDWPSVKQRLRDSEAALDKILMVEDDRLEMILQQRATQLANRTTKAHVAVDLFPILTFAINNEQYGINLQDVRQVLPFENCTPVPGAPPFLLGVTNVRGEILSVIDLRQVLQLARRDETPQGYMLILRHNNGTIALRVDELKRVQNVEPNSFSAIKEQSSKTYERYTQGVTPDNVIVLNTLAILGHPLLSKTHTRQVVPRDNACRDQQSESANWSETPQEPSDAKDNGADHVQLSHQHNTNHEGTASRRVSSVS